MRVILMVVSVIMLSSEAYSQVAPTDKNPANLPVYEYNEGYPIYQDYYHKRRLSIFRDEFNALKKQIEKIEKHLGLTKKGKAASVASEKQIKTLQATTRLLEKRVKELTEQNQEMVKTIESLTYKVRDNYYSTEGGQCFPAHIHH